MRYTAAGTCDSSSLHDSDSNISSQMTGSNELSRQRAGSKRIWSPLDLRAWSTVLDARKLEAA